MDKMSKRSKKGHKQVSGEALDAVVRDAMAEWHRYERFLKSIEAGATADPVSTMLELQEFANEQRQVCTLLARLAFGLEVRETEGNEQALVTEISNGKLRFVEWGGYTPVADLSVVQPELLPQDPRREALLQLLITAYSLFAFALRAMIEVAWDVKEAGYDAEDMAWVGCQVFVLIHRHKVVFSGTHAQSPDNHPAMRTAATVDLAGWVGSKISLTGKKGEKLSAALAEQGGRPFEALLRELPAQALIGWSLIEHKSLEGYKSGVTRSLERLGRESLFKEKLANVPAGMPEEGEEDVLLEEFERQETMHQQRQQLDPLIEQALRRAPQQKTVLQCRREGMEFEEIAAKLDIPTNQVYVQYHNAIQKLIEARKAAGL